MRAFASWLMCVIAGLVLSCCAAVDQIDDRIYHNNLQSQNELNKETLLNVIRASRSQTMNFVAVTQLTGGLSETLNTGLPTITIGPLQTVAQHQFQVTNSLSSGATGGFQANPLVSTTFQSAMLSPVSPRTVALLVSSHPRNPVFYVLIDSITLSDRNFVVRFVNDPGQDMSDDCGTRLKHVGSRRDLEYVEGQCNYRAFVKYFEILLDAGLNSELLPVSQPASKDAPAQSPGHICFDRSRAYVGYDGDPVCGAPQPAGKKAGKKAPAAKTDQPKPDGLAADAEKADDSKGGRKADQAKVEKAKVDKAKAAAPKIAATPAAVRFSIQGLGTFDLSLSFRSPVAVYRFLGTLYGKFGGGDSSYLPPGVGQLLVADEPFVNVTPVNSFGCYTSIDYEGQGFCVPRSSANTALLFTLLQELRNLSIQSTDLNSAFTVRVTN